MTKKELNSIRLRVRYLDEYARTYENNGRLLEYKDFKIVENIVENWVKEQKTLNISDNLTNYINFLSDKVYSKQWNSYVSLGIDRKGPDIKAVCPSVTEEALYNWMLYNRFYIKFIGVINELVAKKVLETKTDITLRKGSKIMDLKYGVDFLDKDNNAYSIKSNIPGMIGQSIWDKQRQAFEKDFPDRQFIKVITNTRYRVLTFGWEHKDKLVTKKIKY